MRSSARSNREGNQPGTRRQIQLAWAVHTLTASGLLIGMVGLEAVVSGDPRLAIFCLIATMVIDGIDGPIARAAKVSKVLTSIDGNVLDLVIDYVTCVILPVAFMAYFGAFPAGWTVVLSGLILFTSVLWFARTEIMTEDRWFRGFPALWSMVAPTFFLLRSPQWVNFAITIILCLLTLTTVKFAHPFQVRDKRAVNIVVTAAWIIAGLILTITWKTTYLPLEIVLIAAPAWFVLITIQRTRRGDLLPV